MNDDDFVPKNEYYWINNSHNWVVNVAEILWRSSFWISSDARVACQKSILQSFFLAKEKKMTHVPVCHLARYTFLKYAIV